MYPSKASFHGRKKTMYDLTKLFVFELKIRFHIKILSISLKAKKPNKPFKKKVYIPKQWPIPDIKYEPKMRRLTNMRHLFTSDDSRQAHDDILDLRKYILPLLLERQDDTCNICKKESHVYDIDHIVYHPEMSIDELQALCQECHKSITDYRPLAKRK